jgi:hypothetical protein
MPHIWINRTKKVYQMNLTLFVHDTEYGSISLITSVECTTYNAGNTFICFDAEGIRGSVLVEGNDWCKEMHAKLTQRVGAAYRLDCAMRRDLPW